MKTARLFVFLLLPLFINPEFAHAQVGTIQEVVAAARANKEPDYIKELITQLGVKLHDIAQDAKVESAKQKYAWWVNMRAVLRITWWTAWEPARDTSKTVDWATEGQDVYFVTMNLARSKAWDVARGDITQDTKSGAREIGIRADIDGVLCNAASAEEKGRIAWRVAEWRALNWLLEHMEIQEHYRETLSSVGDSPEVNLFANNIDLVSFLERNFGNRPSDEMRFVAPWLVQIWPKENPPNFLNQILPNLAQALGW